jgi:ABC-type sulfate transport system permease component
MKLSSILRPSDNAKANAELLVLILFLILFILYVISSLPLVFSMIRAIRDPSSIDASAYGVIFAQVMILAALGFGIRDGFRRRRALKAKPQNEKN